MSLATLILQKLHAVYDVSGDLSKAKVYLRSKVNKTVVVTCNLIAESKEEYEEGGDNGVWSLRPDWRTEQFFLYTESPLLDTGPFPLPDILVFKNADIYSPEIAQIEELKRLGEIELGEDNYLILLSITNLTSVLETYDVFIGVYPTTPTKRLTNKYKVTHR